MGFLDFLKKNQPQISYNNLPITIQKQLQPNPYFNKYANETVDTTVYLLYCDFANYYRWIKDATAPDKYFENYIKSIQLLIELNRYTTRFKFKQPTPRQQLNELNEKYTDNTNQFISRYWENTLKSIEKLKTEKGKINKKEKFFNSLLKYYSEYLNQDNINLLNIIKEDKYTSLEPQLTNIVCGKYNVNTVQEIQQIPIGDYSVLRLLQKSATEHRRNGNFDLAIECLRKSNQISDISNDLTHKLTEKEYMRLYDFIKKYKTDQAEYELNHIKTIHPEFFDKRIISKRNVLSAIQKAKENKEDTIITLSSSNCSKCKKYNNKVFSISGKHKKYKAIPDELIQYGGICLEHTIIANVFFDGISTPPKK